MHVIVEEPRDKPPRAVISPEGPRDVYLPDSSVTLDASQSSDDNGIKTYAWSIADKPPGNFIQGGHMRDSKSVLIHSEILRGSNLIYFVNKMSLKQSRLVIRKLDREMTP